MSDRAAMADRLPARSRGRRRGSVWRCGRLFASLALIGYLLGPLHALAMAVPGEQPATMVICTGHGLKTVAVPGAPSPAHYDEQSCPSCLACPTPCGAGLAPILASCEAPQPDERASAPLHAGDIWHSGPEGRFDPHPQRGPPILD